MGERPDRPDELRRDPLGQHDPLDAREPVPAEREIRERARSGDEVARTRTEIERTRAEMSETVDAIQERLSPQNLKEQAKVQAKETARGAGSGFVERIKQNPVPAAMVGIGLGWLLMSGREGSSGPQRSQDGPYYYERPAGRSYPSYYEESSGSSVGQGQGRPGEAAGQARDRAGQVTGQAQERASQLGSQAQDQAQRAKGGLQRMLRENPLAVGAMAVGLGAAVGFSLPETDKENRAMGEARDSLVERGKERAQDVKERAQRAAEEGQRAAKEEAQNQGLSSE
ncbi:MAG: hypothetical protein CYG60_02375 [Actinobacteria bacterium]|nr:MAG: hypothetical protein CYG60_02375 [Actinomycetota bacterium]